MTNLPLFLLQFVKQHGLPKCPLESSISKEECAVAGLSVGGILENDKVVEGGWSDKPSGCSLTIEGNIIHFNSNPVGARDEKYISICREAKVRCDAMFFFLISCI